MGARVLDFRDHARELDANRYVYAVVSRRARGVSIGVNLNLDKACNFDCPYCQVDRTTPGGPPTIEVASMGAELERLLGEVAGDGLWRRPPFDSVETPLRRVADVAFSGDGEPTAPREFPEAAREARRVLDASGLAVPLRLITNATLLDRPRVREALVLFDELWCKLDAGSPDYFALVDGTRFPFERVLANLSDVARERPIVIQSLFMTWQAEPPSETEIAAYVGRLREIRGSGGRIAGVQVYSVARRPADPRCGPLEARRLEQIAALVRAAGFAAEVYG